MAKSAVKTVSFIAVALMVAKVMGMAREMLFFQTYGATAATDAFISASRIPLLFFDLTLGAAVLSTFVPIFNRYLQESSEKAFRFANSFLNIVFILSTICCVIGMVFPKNLAQILAQFSEETLNLSAQYIIILMPTVIFTAAAYVFVGILQSLGEFNIPAVISLVSNCGVIGYMLFFNDSFGISGLAVAMLIAWSMQVIVQIPSLIKKGYRYSPIIDINDTGIKDAFVLAVPALVASWVQPVCVLINSRYASTIRDGAFSALDAANKLYIIIVGVFAFAITNYIFPQLSKMSGSGDSKGFADAVKKSMLSMLALVVPVAAAMWMFADKIIKVIYESKNFDAAAVFMTADALKFFSIGMIALGVNEILNKAFFAMKNGKMPMYSSLLGIGVNFCFAYLVFNFTQMGLGGLAFATSLALIAISAFLMARMQHEAKFIDKDMLNTAFRIVLATIAMGAAAYGVSHGLSFVELNKYVDLTIVALSGIIMYGTTFLVLKIHKKIK